MLDTDILKVDTFTIDCIELYYDFVTEFHLLFVCALNRSVRELLCVWALPCDITNKNLVSRTLQKGREAGCDRIIFFFSC